MIKKNHSKALQVNTHAYPETPSPLMGGNVNQASRDCQDISLQNGKAGFKDTYC
jgi:hypothetical protein